MPNEGNNGAVRFVGAIRKVAERQIPKGRTVDFGVIKADYSLVLDTFSAPIPHGEWSTLRYLSIESLGEGIENPSRIRPGDRVVAVWIGNEAVVIGSLTRI